MSKVFNNHGTSRKKQVFIINLIQVGVCNVINVLIF